MSAPHPYYRDAWTTIYHGEALSTLAALPSGLVDGVIADPPYSSGGMFRGDRQAKTTAKYRGFSFDGAGSTAPKSKLPEFTGDSRDQRAYSYWSALWLSEALRVSRPGASLLTFTDWRQLPTTTDAVQAGGWVWRGVVVWDKGVGRPVKGRFRNHVEYVVWGTNGPVDAEANPVYLPSVYRAAPPRNRVHLTQKPVDLVAELSAIVKPDGALLDPFMGSGTTLVAARSVGRKAVGIEMDERYCEVAAQRLSELRP